MSLRSTSRNILCATLALSLPTLFGCSSAMISTPVSKSAVTVTGNWQFSSSSANAARLPMISGELSGTSTAMAGILHANSASACISPKSSFAVTGSANENNIVTLTAQNVGGGTLILSGTLAADGKSLTNANYTVRGGSCAFAAPAVANAQEYQPITGTYTGTFDDGDGDTIAINADLTQTPQSDTSGNFTLSGTGTFPQNSCFNSPITVSNTQVTGGSFTLTYADSVTTSSVTASGTFSPDGNTLTVTNWSLSGPCGPAQGSGTTLVKQQ